MPEVYGCGWNKITLQGPGWWVNRLTQGTKKVKMYDYNFNRIYTTPAAPYSDWTANWDDVSYINAC
ncbi:hypothetical protein [Streptomyces yangpuensis]|uniref:hypothetical protein n=1 Tax=Streptomyces yangpuensis TaxID=1648182 RepID=UPI0036572E8A